MKKESILACLAMLLFVIGSGPAWSQIVSSRMHGVITDNGQPLADVQVVATNTYTLRQFRDKTNKKGEYAFSGMFAGPYKVQVINSKNEVLYTNQRVPVPAIDEGNFAPIDVSHPEASSGVAGSPDETATKKMTKEEIARVKADNEKLMGLNALITQAQTAMQAQNWKEAETALKQLLAAAPDTTRWEFYKALGDVQGRSNKYQDAIETYEKAIPLAQMYASGKAPSDPKNPFSDPARAKAGIGQMLTAEGNAYFTLANPVKAAVLFAQAAEISPNPSLVYYNLCNAELNQHDMPAAMAACDKSIAADPSQANPYYLKGKVLYGNGKTENGKFVAPPGAVEALSKYLELAPSGEHAVEVKAMLQQMGKTP